MSFQYDTLRGEVCFPCYWAEGWKIEVDPSSLWVSECTVLSEGSLSPFGISGGGGCSGSSISILSSKCSGWNERVMSLPPYKPHSAIQTGSDSSGQLDGHFDTSMNAVHGSGVCLSSIDLGIGTSPLFDFGCSIRFQLLSLNDDLADSLFPPKRVQCRFRNNTPTVRSDSTDFGTVTADVNMYGSLIASNSPFLKCSSNLAPSDDHPTSTLNHRTGTDLIDIANGMDGQDVDITRCAFTHDELNEPFRSSFHCTAENTKIDACPSSIAVEPQAGQVLFAHPQITDNTTSRSRRVSLSTE
ncbi:hypothetical protein BLNAU_25247 [Blattamonas nauphoetae]|uniref:Uncharacterized protein n=1 Tax=Blattamonas nauphoetae TaxID=2049346 RepID=A0ABQ9WK51_9EUKA|nr:hypothetical protein BLNAU_25247 [Blattamonas nauphoetae]